jgi:hypothetical protein
MYVQMYFFNRRNKSVAYKSIWDPCYLIQQRALRSFGLMF